MVTVVTSITFSIDNTCLQEPADLQFELLPLNRGKKDHGELLKSLRKKKEADDRCSLDAETLVIVATIGA